MSRFKRLLTAFLLTVILGLFFFVNQSFAQDVQVTKSSKIRIVVKNTAQVSSDRILLKDVAQIEAEGFLKEALENIDLGPSPRPEQIRVLESAKVIAAVRSESFLPDNIQLIVPERVYIKQPGQEITPGQIRKKIEKELARSFPNREFHLSAFQVRGLEVYPQGEILFHINGSDMVKNRGRLSTMVSVFIDNVEVDNLSVSGQVEVYENVYFARHFLPKGRTITAGDVQLRRQNIFDIGEAFIVSLDDLNHQVTRSSVRGGTCLNRSHFETPPLIRKGDVISLVSRKNNLVIVASGISKEDGFMNKVIRVENLSSGKQVQGIVTGKSKVEVRF